MPRPLVECIPNFSEGRRPEIISEIEKAIREVPDAHILDQHSDEDHNRTVITFVAPPEAAKKAAFASIAKAAELIDMNDHEGEHPRIGAADVVPFVPISEVTMDDCVELARSLGEQVAQELDIPVYLYEKAASRSDRVNLENIRRGEYESLKEAIGSEPEREPDFGPAALGSAGATVIGARAPLVAYNVYLTTDDVELANKIARAIRHSSGGMRYVKSIGLEVDGRAQVSMNLTDYRRSPIARVQELIRREAERFGVTIHHAELVGLAPQEALIEAARWYLQLDQFEPDQILESRLYDKMAESESGADFLSELAKGSATPGGGSAAAHVGATAAALVAMVARLTTGKDKYADVEARMREIAAAADELRAELVDAVARDAAAFESVMGALRMPKSTEKEKQARADALEAALHTAAGVPLEVAEHATRVLELAAEVVETGNSNAITDAAAAADMAWASQRSAAYNVKINAQSATDEQVVKAWRSELASLKKRAQDARETAHKSLAARAEVEF